MPRDSAPNKSTIAQVVAFNEGRAIRKRSTIFVRDILHRKKGATVARIIRRCGPAEYRVWLRCMMGIYPVPRTQAISFVLVWAVLLIVRIVLRVYLRL